MKIPSTARSISFQGMHGANSDLACREAFPELKTVPCHSFDDAFQAVHDGKADLAMIAVENTLGGRVADVHHLLPEGGLHIIGEHFQPIRHMLLALPGTKLSEIEHVHSHVQALAQCKQTIRDLGLEPHVHADTAGAAAEIAEKGQKNHAAIASKLAADMYGLEILKEDMQDASQNITRFLVMAAQPQTPPQDDSTLFMTSFIFKVRNIPAALYKALGGFATSGGQYDQAGIVCRRTVSGRIIFQ